MADMYKKIYDAVYAMVNEMAEEHGFDCDKAVDSIESSGHVQKIVDMMKPTDTMSDDSKSVDSKTKRSPLEQARHNVQLWTKKLDGDKFPDEDKKNKHIEKLEKEKKKLEKLQGSAAPAPAPAPAPVKEKEKEKQEPKTEDKKVKNIPRWGKDKHGADFKKALQENGVDFTEELEKEFRKLADTMANDEWKKDGKTYLDHMRIFAKSKTSQTEEDTDEESAPDVHTLTLDEMKAIKMLTPIEQTGQFWDADNGRFVTGPTEEADEDFTEVDFNGAQYVVGDKTGRVYKQSEKGDVFAGFIGIGKFKTLKV
jgi:hypothetical protein